MNIDFDIAKTENAREITELLNAVTLWCIKIDHAMAVSLGPNGDRTGHFTEFGQNTVDRRTNHRYVFDKANKILSLGIGDTR
jgi:hypothetical protein